MSNRRGNEGGSVKQGERAAAPKSTTGESSQRPTGAQDDTIREEVVGGDNGGGDNNNNTKNDGNNKNDQDGGNPDNPPDRPDYLDKHPQLGPLFDRLPNIINVARHGEIWGVNLLDERHIPTVNILIKFLRASDGDLHRAEERLISVLEWRRDMNPIRLANTQHNHQRFRDLGYLTHYTDNAGEEVVTTWIIYGVARDFNITYGNRYNFRDWHIALLEMAAHELKIDESTIVMNYGGPDPHKMRQVQDFKNVSFTQSGYSKFKRCAKWTIDTVTAAYQELLYERYFVNVPAIKGCRSKFSEILRSQNTTRPFYAITDGKELSSKFPNSIKVQLPQSYGGKGGDLQTNAREVHLRAPSVTLITADSRRKITFNRLFWW
ncbi:hypothetical protein P168DRAFT_237899 [Aspergillus campestris IBT 28561]|uniref:Phosphatidylinositol transfer protein SFH5 n=1 Tax=Aspergillus campestris (strain IBT 28561) TaxID=1392248 RepID=A0A2I1D230_ASPC2|nr:uncharacterized protein P168DRAFT_237899 [Aspergillus campestris IBT 28561]PKY03917.1 hypothetical protein P168DRAFT_237899 [Aspergillus campestris IBT 28561]